MQGLGIRVRIWRSSRNLYGFQRLGHAYASLCHRLKSVDYKLPSIVVHHGRFPHTGHRSVLKSLAEEGTPGLFQLAQWFLALNTVPVPGRPYKYSIMGRTTYLALC